MAASSSTLRFEGTREVDIRQQALSISVGQVRASRWSFRVSLGAVLDGELDGRFNVAPGVLAGFGLAKQWTRGAWFVTGTYGFSISRTTTGTPGDSARQTLIATDLIRAGVMAGRRFGIVSPYVLARGFGGPVFWELEGEDVTGSDIYFFQLGAGARLMTPSGVAVVLDVSALGERSASLGVTVRL